MENIFVYLYICIYNFMYTFSGAQLWESKINTTVQVEKKRINDRPTYKIYHKAIKMNWKAKTVQNIAAMVPIWWTTANWLQLATAHDENELILYFTECSEHADVSSLTQRRSNWRKCLRRQILKTSPKMFATERDYHKHHNDCDCRHWHTHGG